jgi:hypothetical protein
MKGHVLCQHISAVWLLHSFMHYNEGRFTVQWSIRLHSSLRCTVSNLNRQSNATKVNGFKKPAVFQYYDLLLFSASALTAFYLLFQPAGSGSGRKRRKWKHRDWKAAARPQQYVKNKTLCDLIICNLT